MSNLENLSPAEIDTIYVERLRKLSDAYGDVAAAATRVLNESGKRVYVGGSDEPVYVRKDAPLAAYWRFSQSEVQPHVIDLKACLEESLAPASLVVILLAAQGAQADAQAAVEEVEALYRANPWSRYWLVTSSDGHIHASCHCHTCNKGLKRTGFALVPSLSGQPAAEAVAALGPALCTACFPGAPVEDREQVRIPARLALTLWESGYEAFQAARKKAQADSQKRAADRCPGSGEQGIGDRHFHKCPVCGDTSRRSPTGKVRPHKAPRFIVRQRYGSKCWTGSAWGTSAKAAVYGTKAEADAVAVQVSTPEEKAESCRK